MKKSPVKRRIEKQLFKDLEKKMVFVAGPRQSGKTTMALGLLDDIDGIYYNWDYELDQKKIRKLDLNQEAQMWIFDELHKFSRWRNWLKGIYDIHKTRHSILVTGSAKLDVYNRGGDSLQGRYFLHHLHPFTLSELLEIEGDFSLDSLVALKHKPKQAEARKILNQLTCLGGFPEPFFSESIQDANRWRTFYASRLIRDEIRDLENVSDLDKMQDLYEHLPNTVGSILSINSLKEELDVHAKTVENWIKIFEKNYACFRIPPFGPAKIRATKKNKKLYFWDWAMVEKESARLENLVAMHLLRFCDWLTDIYGKKAELRFFRTSRGHEVDFIILVNKKPYIAIEVKQSDTDLDSNLSYLLERVKIPYAFQLHFGEADLHKKLVLNGSEVNILPGWKFLANLP